MSLNSDGTLNSGVKASFYASSTANSGSYEILSNGKIKINVEEWGTLYREFTITSILANTSGYVGLTFTGKTEISNEDVMLMVWN